MAKYLYIFSYKTPEQLAVNPAQAFPEESCEAVFIEAASPDQALAWGRRISEEFVKRLFGGARESWVSQNFAHWVEADPEKEYPAEVLRRLKVVSYGDFPQF